MMDRMEDDMVERGGDAERYDARIRAREIRFDAAVMLLNENLADAEHQGIVKAQLPGDDTFALDGLDGHSVDFEGARTVGLSFQVKLSDGYAVEIGHDVSQMRFADDLEAFEHLAADPLSWCRDVIDTAKGMRSAEEEEAAA